MAARDRMVGAMRGVRSTLTGLELMPLFGRQRWRTPDRKSPLPAWVLGLINGLVLSAGLAFDHAWRGPSPWARHWYSCLPPRFPMAFTTSSMTGSAKTPRAKRERPHGERPTCGIRLVLACPSEAD